MLNAKIPKLNLSLSLSLSLTKFEISQYCGQYFFKSANEQRETQRMNKNKPKQKRQSIRHSHFLHKLRPLNQYYCQY